MVVTMANNGVPISAPPHAAAPPPNYSENGRLYHGFRRGKYMYPCDEDEMDRLDIYHKFFSVARRGALRSAPFVRNFDQGPRVLDLGTGTGIWAIDIADEIVSQGGEVIGLDLALIQPDYIPANLTFHQRDIESPWYGMDTDSYDLVHVRMLNGSIQNWPDIYSKIFRHLKPNFGWIEQVEIDMLPRCDDGTLPQECALNHWYRELDAATSRAYRPIAYNHDTRHVLERTGFVDITEQVIKIPLNPWPTNPQEKDIGRWFNLGFTQGLQALTLGPLTRMNGWKASDVDRVVADVKREVCSKRYHTYFNMHIITARRPAT